MAAILDSLIRIVQGIVVRGVVRLVDASGKMQTVQVTTTDGTTDEAEHFEAYGFTSRPKSGAEAVVLHVGGTSHPVVIVAADRRYRVTGLAEGEVILHDDQGQKVHLKRDGIYIDGKKVAVTGDTTVSGDLEATSGSFTSAATGSFVSYDGKAVTVSGGVVTAITGP
jgi:phage baseplate assembly protein V